MYVGNIPTKWRAQKMLPFSSPSLSWSRIPAFLRRSELVAATTRAACCLVAISVPYILFVLESVLHR